MSIASYDNLKYRTDDASFFWHINNGFSEPYPRELAIVKRYLSMFPTRNNTCIDVGGHIGTTSLPYSRLFKNVVAYEPNKVSYNFFVENIALNNISNVSLHNKGVFNKSTYCTVVPHAGGNSGCYYITECSPDTLNSIAVVKLDEEQLPSPIDFMKIDTEGSEFYVLEGASKVIKRWKPLIQVETNSSSEKYFGYSKSKIYEFLLNLQYQPFDDDGNNPFFYCP